MKEADENKKSPAPAEKGEKNQAEKTDSSQAGGEELSPEADSKKEEISGYNEHPDQTKVGGG